MLRHSRAGGSPVEINHLVSDLNVLNSLMCFMLIAAWIDMQFAWIPAYAGMTD